MKNDETKNVCAKHSTAGEHTGAIRDNAPGLYRCLTDIVAALENKDMGQMARAFVAAEKLLDKIDCLKK